MGDLAPGGPNEANEVVAAALTVRSCPVRLGQAPRPLSRRCETCVLSLGRRLLVT